MASLCVASTSVLSCAHGSNQPGQVAQPKESQAKAAESKTAEAITAQGPVVTNEKSIPETIHLNPNLQPKEPHQFLVEVRDPVANVTDVRIQIPGSPITVPLKSVGPNLWRGTLSEDQVSRLATGGRIAEYKAQVVARDSSGNFGISKQPLKFNIQTPSMENRVAMG